MLLSIQTADFIAIDSEFSGLVVDVDDHVNDFDDIETKYQKYAHCCQRMNAFQFGFATFKWNRHTKSYMSRPFNVNVWPGSDILGRQVIQFKPNNVKFLSKHQFDFNKLFKTGVSYQRLDDIELVKEKIN